MQAQITEYKAHIYKTIKTGEKIQLYPRSDFTDSHSFYYLGLTENAYWYVSTDNVVTIGGTETNRWDNDQNKTFTYPDKREIIGRTPGSAVVTCQILTRSSTSYSGKRSQVFVELQYHITVLSTNNSNLAIEMTNNPGTRVPKGTSVTLEANDSDADIYYNTGNGWKSSKGSCTVVINGSLTAFAVKKDYVGTDFIEHSFDVINPGDFHALYSNGLDLHFNYVDGNNKTCELYYVPQIIEGEFAIPKSINDYSIVSIGREAFLECTMLTGIDIPETISTIDVAAFSGCTALGSIAIPGTVAFNDRAFEGCTSLKSVVIMEGVKEIPWCAFNGCSSLEEITFPESLQSIDYQAFFGCRNLKSVVSYIQNPSPLYENVFDMGSERPRSQNLKSSDWKWTSATLYVPKGCKEKYETTSGWMLFKNIVEMSDEPEQTTQGDVNGDGSVNGTDLVALANIILGKQSETAAADVNGDGAVNGTDIVALCNIILGRTTAAAPRRAATLSANEGASLAIQPLDIKAGETKTMTIDLNNPNEELTLVQFDLHLPKGLSIKTAGGDLDIDMCDRTNWRKHSLEANEVDGGAYRFLLYSSSNTLISGTEGGIITVNLVADNTFAGGNIVIDNALLVSSEQEETKPAKYEYTIGEVTPPVPPTSDAAALAIESFSIKAGETKTMTIDLNNPNDELTLVQFDLHLPKGLSIKTVGGDLGIDMCDRTNWRKHSLEANEVDGGAYRFLLYSSSNTLISGTEGGIITVNLVADNTFAGGNIVIDNALLVSPEQEETKPETYQYTIGSTTGIDDITTVQTPQRIFNLNGQQLRVPQRGINIVDGKKVWVK